MQRTPVEIRILGCLVEKHLTTPDNYPLSTNALVNACNQRSNRDPVVDYDDRIVDTAMLELRADGLAVPSPGDAPTSTGTSSTRPWVSTNEPSHCWAC